jgi:molybdopterin-dependent oxidoreductase alpha subunit
MARFATIYAAADTAVLVWSMGITQHRHGVDNVQAIVDLALARGNVGRPGTGVMPIRGHSGVQGGAEMGAYSTTLPGAVTITPESAAALEEQYGFPISATPGLRAEAMVLGALRGQVEVLHSSGGNFLDVLPDPELCRDALSRVPLRIHQDIVVTSQMLVDPGEEVLLLPVCTRYEQPGGGTETTTERRIVFSPEVPGPRIGEARTEWEIFRDLAQAVDPERAELIAFPDAQSVRDEIARVVPLYAGIETLERLGDSVQWGGPHIGADGAFPTPDGRAHFAVFEPARLEAPEGSFLLSTRRGKQFNSMVFREVDPLTGAARHDVLVAGEDLERLGLADGAPVRVRSRHGELAARARAAAIRPGNVQVFFPEGNVLVPADDGCVVSGMPAYTEVVEILPG